MQFNVHPQVAQAITRFTAVNDTLKSLSGDRREVYLHELRKLCLAVQAADEVRRALRRAGAPQQQGLLAREVTHQVMGFAYLRELPEKTVHEATRAAEEGYPASQQADPSLSRAGLLVQELRGRAGQMPEEKLHAGLAVQPLTAVLAEHAPLIEELEPVYPFCVDYSNQVLYQTARELEGGSG